MITALVILLLLAFISGAPLFSIMLGGAALGALTSPRPFSVEFSGMVESAFGVGTGDQATVLSTIPLFIYAGYLLAEARTADRLVRFANAILGWVPGGLAIVTICTCALFTVFTGASGVTIVALGGVLLPALVKHGYPRRFSLGLIAGTGSVGLLFPPALPLFVYGTVYGLTKQDPDWDTRRFLFAGIVPGIVLIAMLSAVAVTVAIVKKLPRQKFSFREAWDSFLRAALEVLIPFAVIGGLIAGIGLPEIAALTVSYVVILEVATGQIKLNVLWRTSHESLAMVGAIFIIILASTTLTNYLVTADVPTTLIRWTQAHVGSKIVFLLAINGILLLVGTVMDIFSAIVIVLPLIAPIAKAYGVDPYHLGVIFLLNLEVGYLHPPVGLNLFITSVKFRIAITEVMWATIPFLITMIVALLTITYIPQLTVVPEPVRTGSLNSLQQLVHEASADAGSVKELTLVGIDGTPVPGPDGKPMLRRLAECDKVAEDGGERDKCKGLFLDVTQCRKAPPTGQTAADCERQTIASWTVDNLDLVTVDEVALVDFEGKPLAGADGVPVVKKVADCDKVVGDMAKETCREPFSLVSECKVSHVPEQTAEQCATAALSAWARENLEIILVTEVELKDEDGKVVKGPGGKTTIKLADCDHVADKDTCHELFAEVSKCRISPGDGKTVDECTTEAIASWVSDNVATE